ncbi:MAG: tRNA-dihydrouridine synthase family protein [Clostridia bacterium]|nr:tRNA-dihydrouridine synthase family protein [Clostridia bacterium]
MKFYFAPLEGLTGYVYRNAHSKFFPQTDKYFAPFILANQGEGFKARELNDLLPENNQGIVLIPQILTNNANDFIHTSKKIQQLGYQEINLNLGCPSGTVVAKNRGSGFLAKREELDAFLDKIYAQSAIKISIKTRIGKDDPQEFYKLIDIFNKYPIEELIIHPRIQKDAYKNKPNLGLFKEALELSKIPVCYNGDLFTAKDYEAFIAAFPSVSTVMIGRGLLRNPGLVDNIVNNTKLDMAVLKAFHDQIFENYQHVLSGQRNVLFKMKELWSYLILSFEDSAKYAKKIKKAEGLTEYSAAVLSLFKERAVIKPSLM